MPKLTSISSTFPALKDSGISGSGTRAYYALISYYNNNNAGAAFYNEHFRDILNIGYVGAIGQGYNLPQVPITYIINSTSQYGAQVFENIVSTQNNSGGNFTGNYLNSTNACGEFGNAMIDAYSDGTISNIRQRYNDMAVKHVLNACAINSDHSNRRIVYILYNSRVRAVDRLYGNFAYSMENTSDFVVPSLNAGMQGSASYNKARKELTILSFVAVGGSFNCFTYSNVDFDLYPDPYVALNRPEVTRTNATLSLASNWLVNNNESYYNLKPIVTFSGNVFVSVFFTSNNFSLYIFSRSGTAAITATRATALTVTTSYGIESGAYGQRTITSRDGTTVATFCPYYYYGSGIACFMIDKINNTYGTYQYNDTTFGTQIIPTGDSDWRFYYAGNGYAGNYTGTGLIAYFMKQNAGGFTNVNGTQYLPYFPMPNTTNYPGMTQVVDYPMTPDNKYGPK
jgi:hypothetical protein